jgi:hypothetical protein
VQGLDDPLLCRLLLAGGHLPTFGGELLARRVLILINDALRELVQQRILLGMRRAVSDARQARSRSESDCQSRAICSTTTPTSERAEGGVCIEDTTIKALQQLT